METSLGALEQSFFLASAVASELLSSVWQILAILAVAGLVIVMLLAIIEPGPLVKRRPFSRRQRRPRQTANGAGSTQQKLEPMTGGDGEHADQS
ncbi:MAG: hypothetical protein F4X14_10885 [Caldilineaceae bacterium SB0661_bin_32]|uniref:Uncharacterized protein n=1 Tax=Caldilineaceae bacterium SB0661_bin_32 TaxID=2605255 RepID=A0A6B1D819_9CHLR|nr:hypothetical protein [Caldilineaceae bacterium SB0661_bin_32]